jgi:hypothetical protein
VVLMVGIRFALRTRPGEFFPYRAHAYLHARSIMSANNTVSHTAMRSMMLEHIKQGKEFETDVIPWLEENFGLNRIVPRWVIHRVHRRVFLFDKTDALAFRMRWC